MYRYGYVTERNSADRKLSRNMKHMNELMRQIQSAKRIGIAGHIRPDGDCVGSCCALYNYIKDNFSLDEKKFVVYMEGIAPQFFLLEGLSEFTADVTALQDCDLFIALDCASIDRLGKAEEYFLKADNSILVDHHISNTAYAKTCIVDADASATCEVLFELFDETKISLACANALYLGIVHDTGVFKHSNTKRRTMEIAGILLEKGVSSSKIIDGTFFEKSYLQTQLLGRSLTESVLYLEGKVIASIVSLSMKKLYGAVSSDFDGVIDNLRVTRGVEVAILITEEEESKCKVSMRSNHEVNVSAIAQSFGGGGHVKAAGCTMTGSPDEILEKILSAVSEQL